LLDIGKTRKFELPFSRIIFVSLLLIALPISIRAQSSKTGIRSVDFKDFSYPWLEPDEWPDHVQWMSLNIKNRIRLTKGKWDQRDLPDRTNDTQFTGLTYEDVGYGKLSSITTECAIVVLRYDSGGTQYHHWVYIYRTINGTSKLMGFFHAGDRAYYGLYRVFVKNGFLNVELFDLELRQGDCCSTGFLNFQYQWNGSGFETVGRPTKGEVDSPSRRSVSVFGLPTDQK
jgi:hypothetical protein